MRILVIICALLLLNSQAAFACTDFVLKSRDGAVVVARSMEFAADLKSNLRASPRGRKFTEVTPEGRPALSWASKYGYVYLDGFNADVALDGMNEVGLSFEYLYLPGLTQYQDIPAGKERQGLPYIHLGDYLLSNCKTIDDVRRVLSSIYVFAQLLPDMGSMIFPLHAAVYDESGKGIIIEFVNGKMNIYDNVVGVLTNAPTYDWQVTNLRDYINLSPWTPNPIVIGGMVFATTGQGSGMKGLPGDVSPPSRFVKINVLKATAYPVETALGAVNLAEHIMDTVDIPFGFVRAKNNENIAVESTQWVVFKDLTNHVLYYKTYGNTTLRSINLRNLDFTTSGQYIRMPVADKQYVLDMTKAFRDGQSV